jgi:DNA repair protein RadA/Sms
VVLPEQARGELNGEAGLSLNTVGGLTSLVAEIAARGTPRARQDSARPENARREGSVAEKNATPTRFRRQDG